MTKMSSDKLVVTQPRLYIFSFFSSLYALLSFWIVANFVTASTLAFWNVGIFIIVFLCNLAALRWVAEIEPSEIPKQERSSRDKFTLFRFILGHCIIFLSCVYGIIKCQSIVQNHFLIFNILHIITGLIIFLVTYFIMFTLTFIKLDLSTSTTQVRIPKQSPNSSIPVNRSGIIQNLANVPHDFKTTKNIHADTLKGYVNDWDIFADVINEHNLRASALAILRKSTEWLNVCPPTDLYEKKGSAFFQQAAIRALGDSQDPSAVPFLINLLGKTYDMTHGRETFHRPRWPNMGVDAASALARIGKPASEALQQSLTSRERLVRLYAVCGIALLRDITLYSAIKEAANQEVDTVLLTYMQRTMTSFERKEFTPPELSSLEVIIDAATIKLRIGEPVKLSRIIRNHGPKPIVINLSSAKITHQLFSVKSISDPTSMPLSPYETDSAPKVEDLFTLSPGETHTAGPFDLRESFDCSKTGIYEIQGIYQNHFPGIEYGLYAIEGRILSKPVVIEISAF